MRYTLIVRADCKAQVEAIISKLPSHYEERWQTVHRLSLWERLLRPSEADSVTCHDGPVEGAVKVLQPIGQLATLTLVPATEGTETKWWQKTSTAYYTLSGEFDDAQLKLLNDAMAATGLVKSVDYWDGKEPEVVRASVGTEV